MVCLRVCSYILKNAIPSADRLASRTCPSLQIYLEVITDSCRADSQSNPADRVALIKTSFDTLLSIGSSFEAKIQEEVRAVAISLYGGMLARSILPLPRRVLRRR
jgi:hypothetical protein